jgi:hypothetical protein
MFLFAIEAGGRTVALTALTRSCPLMLTKNSDGTSPFTARLATDAEWRDYEMGVNDYLHIDLTEQDDSILEVTVSNDNILVIPPA